jgi:23S rRNA-/tRNA-specific pseudouridylate synthase
MADDILSYFNFDLTHPQETALAVCLYLAEDLYRKYPDHPLAKKFNAALINIDRLYAAMAGDNSAVNDNHERARNIKKALVLLKQMPPSFKTEHTIPFIKALDVILKDADIIVVLKSSSHPVHYDHYWHQYYDLHSFINDVNQYVKINDRREQGGN